MIGLPLLFQLTAALFASTSAAATATALASTSNSSTTTNTSAATVNATTPKNLNIQYAILTITNEHALFQIETVINATNGSVGPKQLLPMLLPVKTQVLAKIFSGQADPLWVETQIDHLKTDLEDEKPGFQKALDEYDDKYPLNIYRLNNRTTEAIWDFTYAACAIAATNVKSAVSQAKSDEITAKLENLNDELEVIFRSGVALNVTELADTIGAFTCKAVQIYANYAWSVVNTGDSLVDEYRNELTRQKKKAAETQAPAARVAVTLAPTVAPVSGAHSSAQLATTTVIMGMASVAVSYYGYYLGF